MPLQKSSSPEAFKSNLKAEIAAGKPQKQALAIAYRVKREGRASGGPPPAPWFVRNESRELMHTGPINSIVPGRTDRHNMSVPAGSYVVPSQAVSHLGQNNTAAGMAVLDHMFSQGPYGTSAGKIAHGVGAPRAPRAPSMGNLAKGGATSRGPIGAPVPVITAGGEYVIDPSIVAAIGHGDIDLGHKILDAWILKIQKDHVKTIKNLPAPAKK